MRLIHYSNNPIYSIKGLSRIKPKTMPNGKPAGFWVSVEGKYDWEWWCKHEGFYIENLKYKHEVTLYDNDKFLTINHLCQLDSFHDRYAFLPKHYEAMSYMREFNIKWEDLFNKYSGIIISDYLWERRLNYMWYYGLDCASGCIWDVSAIK